MTVAIRCIKCHKFYNPQLHSICLGCGTPWDMKGKRKKFYADFTHLGARRRVPLRARILHAALTELDDFDIDRWWRAKREGKRGESLTVKQAYGEFIKDSKTMGCKKRKISPNRKRTLIMKEMVFGKYVLPLMGNRRLNDITIEDVERITNLWMESHSRIRRRRLSPSTVNLNLRVLRTFFQWAKRKEFTAVDPTDQMRTLEEPDPEIHVLNPEQIARILDFLRKDDTIPYAARALIEFMMLSGLRAWSEAASLKWDWVRFAEKTVVIPPDHTKQKKQNIRALNDFAWEVLRRMKAYRKDNNAYVFPNPKTGKPYTQLRAALRKVAKVAGLEALDAKDFRHSFISATRDENPLTTQKIIGHSSLEMQSNYLHVKELEDMRTFENRIAKRLTSSRVQSREQDVPIDWNTAARA